MQDLTNLKAVHQKCLSLLNRREALAELINETNIINDKEAYRQRLNLVVLEYQRVTKKLIDVIFSENILIEEMSNY